MALIDCKEADDPISLAGMDDEIWQRRARAAGLTQKALAKLLGHAENTISRQLRGHWESGIPKHVRAMIVAWERLPEEARAEVLAWAEETD